MLVPFFIGVYQLFMQCACRGTIDRAATGALHKY